MIVLTESMAGALVAAAVGVPALAALVAVMFGVRSPALAGVVATMPAVLLGLFAPAEPIEITVDWLLLGARFGVDALTPPFALLTGLLWAAASVACAGYFDAEARRRIAPWWLLTLAGSVGLVFAIDSITFFLFFAVMSFASYGLVVHRGDPEAMRAGRIYMGYVVAGEVALFSGLVMTGSHPDAAALLLLVGFGIKAGALTLHSWLPLAHAAAPAPASAVLSGVMLKAGLLGWLRFVEPGAAWAGSVGLVLVGLGLAGAYAGAVAGVVQSAPKTVLAYSSVSQMGIAIAAFGILLAGAAPGAAAACALFALHHAFAKGALFLGVGVMERLSGTARRFGLLLMALPALALVGIPFTSGMAAKSDIKSLAAGLPAPWAEAVPAALVLAAIGTAALMLRLLATLGAPGEARCPRALWMPASLLALAGFALVTGPPASWNEAGLALLPPVVALALAAAVTRLMRANGWGMPSIPPGDLLAIAGAAKRHARRATPPPPAPAGPSKAPGPSAAGWSGSLEDRLAGSEILGVLVLALALVLGMVLAVGG